MNCNIIGILNRVQPSSFSKLYLFSIETSGFHKCNSVILSFESSIFTNVKFKTDREYLGNLRAVIRSRKFNCTGVLAQSYFCINMSRLS